MPGAGGIRGEGIEWRGVREVRGWIYLPGCCWRGCWERFERGKGKDARNVVEASYGKLDHASGSTEHEHRRSGYKLAIRTAYSRCLRCSTVLLS